MVKSLLLHARESTHHLDEDVSNVDGRVANLGTDTRLKVLDNVLVN